VLALFFACIAVLCYQYYLEYWTGLPLGSPSQSGDHNIFVVVDIPGKGKGVVAARDIKVFVMQNQIYK
jgi:hypothetical protein